MNDHDLNWLAAQRPSRSGADKDAHDRALMSLLRHATSRPTKEHRRPRLSGLLNMRVLAVATGTGAAAIAAAVVLSAGNANPAHVGHSSTHTLQAVITPVVAHHGSRSPLIRLADQIGASTATGDATLIQRSTIEPGSKQPITVYDLYGDNNTYYFSHDESGLPAQVSGGYNQAAGLFGREVAAAKEAANGDVTQGALDLANAPAPNGKYRITSITQTTPTASETAAAKAKDKLLGQPYSAGTLFDNWAWEDAQDAIIAGAGDPQVRAGVLKILALLPDVTVTAGTSADGQPTLVLTGGADEVGSGYQEQLIINAETGIPIEFVGGTTPGSGPTVNYQVKRVTLSDIAGGTVPSF